MKSCLDNGTAFGSINRYWPIAPGIPIQTMTGALNYASDNIIHERRNFICKRLESAVVESRHIPISDVDSKDVVDFLST
jgi:hypothetical protein